MVLFDPGEYDGLKIKLFWDELEVGYSFFIPCLDTVEMLHLIYTEAESRGYKLTHEERIEQGMAGIRWWRISTDEIHPPSSEP